MGDDNHLVFWESTLLKLVNVIQAVFRTNGHSVINNKLFHNPSETRDSCCLVEIIPSCFAGTGGVVCVAITAKEERSWKAEILADFDTDERFGHPIPIDGGVDVLAFRAGVSSAWNGGFGDLNLEGVVDFEFLR